MLNWESTLLGITGSVADAIRIIDGNRAHICLVVDEQRKLRGTITDGDVRRGLLKSVPLTAPVGEIMKSTPLMVRDDEVPRHYLTLMRQAEVRQLPLVDAQGHVTGLVIEEEITGTGDRPNWVVLMAGGLGARLRPLTDETPKPMLKVGTKPLLETIIENFVQHGFTNFYISVNYLADKVKDYFGDGSKWSCTIRYLEEKEQLGTAGALKLLPEKPAHPLIIMNGDVLTKVNFTQLLDFHREHGAAATMCVREYDFQVPYGVVDLEDQRISKLIEKPVYSFFVNAGIYVIEPELLDSLPQKSGLFHMTDLFDLTVKTGKETAAFPIREYWIDIGQIDDFHRANGDFSGVFA